MELSTAKANTELPLLPAGTWNSTATAPTLGLGGGGMEWNGGYPTPPFAAEVSICREMDGKLKNQINMVSNPLPLAIAFHMK